MNDKNPLLKKIAKANEVEVDTCWAILKYKGEIGILRKIRCLCNIFGVNVDKVTPMLPQDDDGRILDKDTRHEIHEVLLARSQEVNN